MASKPKRVRTDEQKRKRAETRVRLTKEARAKGLEILEAAKKGGYTPGKVPRRFQGTGRYRGSGRYVGQGGFIDDGIDILGAGIKKGAGWLTDKAAGLLKSFIGGGDYLAGAAPSANEHVLGAMPKMVGARDEPCLVIEDVKEVGKLTATDVFKRTAFHIQPGLGGNDALFHWLPSIARKFESYSIEAAIFYYKPLVSPLQDAASGDLAMVVIYDVNDEPPQTMSQCLNTYMAVGGRPMDSMMMALECAPSQSQTRIKYVRGSEPDASDDTDHNLYDAGIFYVCQEGQPTATVGQTIGRMYITYKIKFYKPLDEYDEQDPVTAHYSSPSATPTVAASPFGATESDFVIRSPPGFNLTWVSPTTLAFPSYVKEGKWMLVYRLIGNAGAFATTITSTGTGWAAMPVWMTSGGVPSSSSFAVGPLNAEVAIGGIHARVMTVNAPAPTITLTVAYGGNFYWDLFISPVDVDLATLAASKKSWRRRMRRGNAPDYGRLTLLESRIAMCEVKEEIATGVSEYHEEKEDMRDNDMAKMASNPRRDRMSQRQPDTESDCGSEVIISPQDRAAGAGRLNRPR